MYNSDKNYIFGGLNIGMTDLFAYENRRKRIGTRIKALRQGMEMTQKQLAGRITDIVPTDKDKGFGQSTISGWERGEQLPPLPKLIALSEIFQCDISYLLCDYDKKKKNISDVSKLTGLSIPSVESVYEIKKAGGTMGLEILSLLIMSPSFWNAIANLNYARYAIDNYDKPMSDCLQTALEELKMVNGHERHPGATVLSPKQMCDLNLYQAAQEFSKCAEQIVNRSRKEEVKYNG